MDYADIRRLVKLVESSNISEIEIEEGGGKVRILKYGVAPQQLIAPQQPHQLAYQPGLQSMAPPIQAPAPSTPAPQVASKTMEVLSPMVGTFYRAPSPEAPAYVEVGDLVRPGHVLCIVEAMKLMNEIESEVAGRIIEILPQNAQAVEFGQLLFRIDPT